VPLNPSIFKQSLLGSPSTIKVDIPLLSQFILGTSVVNARLELGRSDGWKGIGNGQGRELSVLEATLKGTVRPKGIRYLIYLFLFAFLAAHDDNQCNLGTLPSYYHLRLNLHILPHIPHDSLRLSAYDHPS
jgi:hypothetical protein